MMRTNMLAIEPLDKAEKEDFDLAWFKVKSAQSARLSMETVDLIKLIHMKWEHWAVDIPDLINLWAYSYCDAYFAASKERDPKLRAEVFAMLRDRKARMQELLARCQARLDREGKANGKA